jgi:hypothetical protein
MRKSLFAEEMGCYFSFVIPLIRKIAINGKQAVNAQYNNWIGQTVKI